MVKFAVHGKVAEGKEEAFVNALGEYLPTVTEEPGTLQYDVLQSKEDSTSFLFYEAYVDEAAKQAHVSSDAFKKYFDTIRPLLAEPPSQYTVIESAKP